MYHYMAPTLKSETFCVGIKSIPKWLVLLQKKNFQKNIHQTNEKTFAIIHQITNVKSRHSQYQF